MDKLRQYVDQGGILVSEGCPLTSAITAGSGPNSRTTVWTNCSARAKAMWSSLPDLLDKLTLEVQGQEMYGRYFLQEYELAGGQAAGRYGNGHIAAVEHRQGKGGRC